MQWVFENGGVYPSPIPLANKKTKILAGKIKDRNPMLRDIWTETQSGEKKVVGTATLAL